MVVAALGLVLLFVEDTVAQCEMLMSAESKRRKLLQKNWQQQQQRRFVDVKGCIFIIRAGFNGEQIFCFPFHQNQNSPVIGQRKIAPPRFKSAHQSGANFDSDEM